MVKCRGIRDIKNEYKIRKACVERDKLGHYYIGITFVYEEVMSKIVSVKFEDIASDIFKLKKVKENVLLNAERIDFESTVGLDFKIGDVYVASDGSMPDYGHLYKKMIRRLKKEEKRLGKKKRFSKGYFRQINVIRKNHKYLSNKRKHKLNNISYVLSVKYDNAVLESLSLKEIAKKLGNGTNTYDTSYYKFTRMLLYKMRGYVIYISKWFPSSKMCNNCGNIKEELALSDRIYVCNKCRNNY